MTDRRIAHMAMLPRPAAAENRAPGKSRARHAADSLAVRLADALVVGFPRAARADRARRAVAAPPGPRREARASQAVTVQRDAVVRAFVAQRVEAFAGRLHEHPVRQERNPAEKTAEPDAALAA